jgi:hypothetical protein
MKVKKMQRIFLCFIVIINVNYVAKASEYGERNNEEDFIQRNNKVSIRSWTLVTDQNFQTIFGKAKIKKNYRKKAKVKKKSEIDEGCFHCQRERKKCSKGQPCTNCSANKFVCSFEKYRPLYKKKATRKPHATLVKNACYHCRKNHRKCSEHRPCDNCVIMHWQCSTPKSSDHDSLDSSAKDNEGSNISESLLLREKSAPRYMDQEIYGWDKFEISRLLDSQ